MHIITEGQHVISQQIKLSETQNLVLKLLVQDCKNIMDWSGNANAGSRNRE